MSLTLIDSYSIKFTSGDELKSIWLRHGDETIAVLVFRGGSSSLPPDTLVKNSATLQFHLQDFPKVLHILEQEKPVYLEYSEDMHGLVSHADELAVKTRTDDRTGTKKAKPKGR